MVLENLVFEKGSSILKKEWSDTHKLTRKDAIRMLVRVTDQDDPYWANLTDEFYDEDTDLMPTLDDVLTAVGISITEIREAEGR